VEKLGKEEQSMNTEVAKKENREAAVREAGPQTAVTYVPDVDIMENSEAIRLLADLPGVEQKDVDVTVENNILTIEARAAIRNPEGFTLAGQEYGIGKYHRDFTLSNAVNVEKISARVKHGVLEVVIPKRDEVKTRKIQIG